jgi:glycosyltransferase involved in cell wall biosynthesis
MLDFEEYGFRLPIIPKKGIHYVDLRFYRLAETVEFMAADKERLSAIGEAGRAWALEHYSPKAVATRFVDEIAKAYGQMKSN